MMSLYILVSDIRTHISRARLGHRVGMEVNGDISDIIRFRFRVARMHLVCGTPKSRVQVDATGASATAAGCSDRAIPFDSPLLA